MLLVIGNVESKVEKKNKCLITDKRTESIIHDSRLTKVISIIRKAA